MILLEHKLLLTQCKKAFIQWVTEPLTQREKELQAYHEVKQLYEAYGYAVLRWSYRVSKGKRDFIRNCKYKANSFIQLKRL